MSSIAGTKIAHDPAAASTAARAEDLELGSVYELNRRCLDALVEAARNAEAPTPFGFIAVLRGSLKSLDAAARQAASECPFLLLDMRFRDDVWWRTIQRQASHASREPESLECFPRRRAVHLAHSALTLAWHMARSRPEATPLLLGMSRGCAEVIASLGIAELESLAQRHHRLLSPRWEDRPILWKSLLSAATRGDAETLRMFRLHGLQRIVGELLHLAAAR